MGSPLLQVTQRVNGKAGIRTQVLSSSPLAYRLEKPAWSRTVHGHQSTAVSIPLKADLELRRCNGKSTGTHSNGFRAFQGRDCVFTACLHICNTDKQQ